MKKLISALMAGAMMFGLVACGGGSTASPSPSASAPAPSASAPVESSSVGDVANDPKVTLVYAEVNPLDTIVGQTATAFKEKVDVYKRQGQVHQLTDMLLIGQDTAAGVALFLKEDERADAQLTDGNAEGGQGLSACAVAAMRVFHKTYFLSYSTTPSLKMAKMCIRDRDGREASYGKGESRGMDRPVRAGWGRW